MPCANGQELRYVRRSLAPPLLAALALAGGQVQADDPNSAPNPYHVVDHWAKLPEGRAWGQPIGVEIDRDGTSVWVYDRCGAKTCEGSTLAPIQKFDASGKLVASFGAGLINWPHGLGVDRDGNVWVTDGHAGNGRGQTAIKFSPDGRVLMTLGKPGVAGNGHDELNGPSDVLVAPNGDIYVADGHGEKTNDRIVKYSPDGKFITAWGRHGAEPGEFDVPHGLAMDSMGRLFVADRANSRIQIFDPDGNFLGEWREIRPAEQSRHPRRHSLRDRRAIEQQSERAVSAGHSHRQRQGRPGDRLHHAAGTGAES